MPRLTKDVLKLMKNFTDEILKQGDIASDDVASYFNDARNNESFSQDAREDAGNIYNTIMDPQYNAHDKLQEASNKIGQLLADPDYPDNAQLADEKTQDILQIFEQFHQKYVDLRYNLDSYIENTEFKELNKSNSRLRPIMDKLNAYAQIDTYYDLINVQAINGNIRNHTRKLREEEKELEELTGFVLFEVRTGERLEDAGDISREYESQERVTNEVLRDLTNLKSKEGRDQYETNRNYYLAEAEKRKNTVLAQIEQVVEDCERDVEIVREQYEDAQSDHKSVAAQEEKIRKLAVECERAKKEYLSQEKKLEEKKKERNDLYYEKEALGLAKHKETRQYLPSRSGQEADELNRVYYNAKRFGDNWRKIPGMFENFMKTHQLDVVAQGFFRNGPDSIYANTIRKNYKEGTPFYNQRKEVEEFLDEVGKLIPVNEFLADIQEKLKDVPNERWQQEFLDAINEESTIRADKAVTDLAENKLYSNYLVLMQNRINRGGVDETKEKEKYDALSKNIDAILEENPNLNNVNLKLVDKVVEEDKRLADFAIFKRDYEESKDRYERLENELNAEKIKMEEIKKKSVINNTPDFVNLKRQVKQGKMTEEQYNAVVEEKIKGQDINRMYDDMLKKVETSLTSVENEKKKAEKTLKNEKKENERLLNEARKNSFEAYLNDVGEKAQKYQNEKNKLDIHKRRYHIYEKGLEQLLKVEKQREVLYQEHKTGDTENTVAKGIDKKIRQFMTKFPKSRKSPAENPTDGNSDEYNAIYTTLQSFGDLDNITKMKPEDLKNKLNDLNRVAAHYEDEKRRQPLHFDIFASRQRTWRLNLAREIQTFCKNEVGLIGEYGWMIPDHDRSYINKQSNLIPQAKRDKFDNYDRNAELLKDRFLQENPDIYEIRRARPERIKSDHERFREYTDLGKDNPNIKAEYEKLLQIEKQLKDRLKEIDRVRRNTYNAEIIEREEVKHRFYDELTWETIYIVDALEDLHTLKEGETPKERMQRLEKLADPGYQDEIISRMKDTNQAQYEKQRKVAEFFCSKEKYPINDNKQEDDKRLINVRDIRDKMLGYDSIVYKKSVLDEMKNREDAANRQKEQARQRKLREERERQEREAAAANKNIIKPDKPIQDINGPTMPGIDQLKNPKPEMKIGKK